MFDHNSFYIYKQIKVYITVYCGYICFSRLISDMLVVNGTDSGAQDTPDKNTSLFVPPAPMNSPVTSSTAAEASPERGKVNRN